MAGDPLERWSRIDSYFEELLLPPEDALEASLAVTAAAGLPAIQVSALQGAFLRLLVRLCRARSILEIGTLAGYSTIWLAGGLPSGGRVMSLELDAERAEVARSNIARAGFAELVEVRVGRAVDELSRLVEEGRGPFDLVFVDADKRSNPDYLRWALKLIHPGSVIVVDNVVREGTVLDSSTEDPDVRGVREFAELLAASPRLSATALQTVGSKGHDGFVLALVTE